MRDISRVASGYLLSGSAGDRNFFLRGLATLWIKLSRYFLSSYEPDTDAGAAAIRSVSGGVGAPIVLPSAKLVDDLHRHAAADVGSAREQSNEETPKPKLTGFRAKPGAVLVLSTDSKTYGGIQRYAQMWAQALFELGYRPRTVALWRNGVRPDTRIGGARTIRFVISALLVSVLRRPKATICTHIGLSPVAMLLKKIFGIPYAVSLHGDDSWRQPQKKRVVKALNEADLLIPVSHFTRDVVCAWSKIPEKRTYVTGSILSPELEWRSFSTDPQAYGRALRMLYEAKDDAADVRSGDPGDKGPSLITAEGGEKRSEPLILTVARLDANAPYKRHDLVLRAVARIRDKYPGLRYLVVGDGSYRPFLESLAKELSIDDIVEFTGKISEERLASVYGSATCFAMPSRISLDPAEGEGFGLVYLEAGVWGVPSVAAAGGGSTETVLDGESGILAAPDSLESLTDAIERILSGDALRKKLGQGARVRALEFSYPRFKRRCAAVMKAVTEVRYSDQRDPRSIAIAEIPEYPRHGLFLEAEPTEAANSRRPANLSRSIAEGQIAR